MQTLTFSEARAHWAKVLNAVDQRQASVLLARQWRQRRAVLAAFLRAHQVWFPAVFAQKLAMLGPAP